ncbi:ferritin family protein [Pyrococcus sp.]|uniref:ferritin-like domain-containing protein n=1 Tax=Pyrococcus sp. TaxID=33866 RepID=UPI00258A8553|nr:ferritin family protein [Pyrococcus sp.]
MEVTEKEIFDIAINSEIRAKEAYEKLASMTKSEIIREELLFLASEEEKHKEIIKKIAEKYEVSEEEGKKVKLEVLGEFKVIAEKMSDIIKKPDVNIDEIYEVAMEAELVSEKFYRELSKYAATESAKILLEMLADMERNHYNILKKQYDYITRYPDIYKEEFYDQLMKDINFNF